MIYNLYICKYVYNHMYVHTDTLLDKQTEICTHLQLILLFCLQFFCYKLSPDTHPYIIYIII